MKEEIKKNQTLKVWDWSNIHMDFERRKGEDIDYHTRMTEDGDYMTTAELIARFASGESLALKRHTYFAGKKGEVSYDDVDPTKVRGWDISDVDKEIRKMEKQMEKAEKETKKAEKETKKEMEERGDDQISIGST